MIKKELIVVCISILLMNLALFSNAEARWTGPALGDSNSNRSSFGFKLLGNLKFQRANFASKDGTTVKKKQLNGVGADAAAAIRFGSFMFGAGGEYIKLFQQSSASDNINLSGSMTNYFGLAGISLGRFALTGKYYFFSEYDLEQKSSTSEKVSYTTPSGSYGVSLNFRLSGRSVLSLDYNKMSFSKQVRNGSTSKLSSPMEFASYGLNYGFIF